MPTIARVRTFNPTRLKHGCIFVGQTTCPVTIERRDGVWYVRKRSGGALGRYWNYPSQCLNGRSETIESLLKGIEVRL